LTVTVPAVQRYADGIELNHEHFKGNEPVSSEVERGPLFCQKRILSMSLYFYTSYEVYTHKQKIICPWNTQKRNE
jgi:hypothetical protein